jgi:hypothetical protein
MTESIIMILQLNECLLVDSLWYRVILCAAQPAREMVQKTENNIEPKLSLFTNGIHYTLADFCYRPRQSACPSSIPPS